MKFIIYLRSFLFSEETVDNPNIYPYNVFAQKTEKLLLFGSITILYGSNVAGKSTMVNIIANKLQLAGQEYATNNKYGKTLISRGDEAVRSMIICQHTEREETKWITGTTRL